MRDKTIKFIAIILGCVGLIWSIWFAPWEPGQDSLDHEKYHY